MATGPIEVRVLPEDSAGPSTSSLDTTARSHDHGASLRSSVAGSSASLIPSPKELKGISMDEIAYNRHEHKTLTVKDLHYAVEEKGMEWWQALSSFQMPCQGGGSSCKKGGEEGNEKSHKREVLNGVSFEVQSGEMLAVLGSSGM